MENRRNVNKRKYNNAYGNYNAQSEAVAYSYPEQKYRRKKTNSINKKTKTSNSTNRKQNTRNLKEDSKTNKYKKQTLEATRQNHRKSTFLDEPEKRVTTQSKYTRRNLKRDAQSVENRRKNLKGSKGVKYYDVDNSPLGQKLSLLSQHSLKVDEMIDGERITVYTSNTTNTKLPVFILLLTLLCVAFAALFINTQSNKHFARENFENELNKYNELKLEKDNLTLELSKINNDEEYKLIAKNKLGMDNPKSYQIVKIPLESVSHSEIYTNVKENTTELNEHWYSFLTALWR